MNELNIYLKNGKVFTYQVADAVTAHMHMVRIWEEGYKTSVNDRMTWYGPHYIDAIVYTGEDADTLTHVKSAKVFE